MTVMAFLSPMEIIVLAVQLVLLVGALLLLVLWLRRSRRE